MKHEDFGISRDGWHGSTDIDGFHGPARSTETIIETFHDYIDEFWDIGTETI